MILKYFFDVYCRMKYFFYFNLFLNAITLNYLHYNICKSNNKLLIKYLYYCVNLNGCILIKLVQWIVNQLYILNNTENSYIFKLFSNFYENCSIHNLNYTKNLFFHEFGYLFDDIFSIDNSYNVKSGSIAQVYKAYTKNNTCVAIKVVHPEIEYQMIYPIYMFKLYNFFVTNFKCFKKYDTIFNFDSFFDNLKKQINMNNEYNNNIYFYNKYIDNDYVVIPKPIMKSQNFLIMEYVEGEYLENINIGHLKKQIVFVILKLFVNDNYMFSEYFHPDLHDANWKIVKTKKSSFVNNNNDHDDNNNEVDSYDYKIVIYDFGYIIKNDFNDDIKNLIYYMDINDLYKMAEIIFKYIDNFSYCNSLNNDEVKNIKDNFIKNYIEYSKSIYPFTDNAVLCGYKFCYDNNYKLNNTLLEIFISMMLLKKHFKKYLFANYYDINNYYKYIYDINLFYISICEKYNIFHDVKNYINDYYINSEFLKEKYKYENEYLNSINKNEENYDI